MTEREEVLLEPGFVLHQRPYRDSSQLIECLTPDHGRIGLIARGSRGGQRRRRAFLQPFYPVKLSWVRRRELGQLTHVEPDAAGFDLGGDSLLAGFYVNELVLRLVARDDAHPDIFVSYRRCLEALADQPRVARTLRLFEWELLSALGYGLDLERDSSSGEPLRADARYVFELEHGARQASAEAEGTELYSGRELISLRTHVLDDDDSLRAAKRLLSRVLNSYLGERPLNTRAVLRQIVSRRTGCSP